MEFLGPIDLTRRRFMTGFEWKGMCLHGNHTCMWFMPIRVTVIFKVAFTQLFENLDCFGLKSNESREVTLWRCL